MQIPPSTPYADVLISLPARWLRVPTEGPRQITADVQWANVPTLCVAFDFAGNTTLEFSQISAVTVDNSQSGADVTFMFPDTSATLTVPGYVSGTYTVYTNGAQFYLNAPDALSEDVTSVIIHNTSPPNISIPKTDFSSVSAYNSLTLAAGTTQIVPPSVSGTLTGATLLVLAGAVVPGNAFYLVDGNGQRLALGGYSSPDASSAGYGMNLLGLNVRFNSGISLSCAGGSPAASTMSPILYYRTP